MAGWGKTFGRGLAMLSLFVLVDACAIDPVPTPGQGDGANQVDDRDAFAVRDTNPANADAATGGCTCIDRDGKEWHCDSAAGGDACPCEPSAITCPEGTVECEGAEVLEGAETPDAVDP